MARCACSIIVQCLCFFTCLHYVKCQTDKVDPPWITAARIVDTGGSVRNPRIDASVNYILKIEGVNLIPRMIVRPTWVTGDRGDECDFNGDYDRGVDATSFTRIRPFNRTVGYMSWTSRRRLDGPVYLCVGTVDAALNPSISVYQGKLIKWIHQGRNVFLIQDKEASNAVDGYHHFSDENFSESSSYGVGRRRRRDTFFSDADDRKIVDPNVQSDTTMESLDKRKRADEEGQIHINGLRVESSEHDPIYEDGVLFLLAQTNAKLRLFGEGLTSTMQIAFTTIEAEGGGICEFPSADIFKMVEGSVTNYSAVVEVQIPFRSVNDLPYYLCLKESGNGTGVDALRKKLWRHQGSEKWLQFKVYERLLPIWVTIIIIVLLLFFSALFSGLTLGLMSMDKTDLKILCTTGTDLERQYASAIMPVRSHGSLLLCSLLLGNVLVNSVLTILMDDLTSGLIAVIFSTLAIVIFGEIMPQAICSRHGLAVGAKTIYITKCVILLTFVVAYPISKILDYMLGEEIGNVYNRERLKELVKTGTDIEKDEVNIISGALELRKKTVADVMTKLEDVYMLDYEAVLDFETVSEIMKSGFSRIPVFDGQRSNIVSMLFIKDLAFVDPDDNTPLKQLCDFYQNLCYFVFEDLTLDVLFRQFKDGNRGHMAFVHRVNAEGEGDPFYETIGLVTLEDVIEELIQAEIVDETDVFTDNRSKRRRVTKHAKQDFTTFCERRENQRIHISPQLTLATFQYLSTTVDAFKPDAISETILRRLIKQDVIYQIKVKNKEKGKTDPSTIIYQQGKPVDYFVLILEGRVEVTIGREEMKFESGPFTYFGTQALTQNYPVGGDSPTTAVPSSNTGSLQSVNIDTMSRHTFVPDYTVRAITEVFYIRIKRSLYLAAKRATLLENSQKTDDHFDDEVDKLLHSLDEDDRSQGQASQDSPVMNRNSNANQSDKESLQRCGSAAGVPDSPRSYQPVSNPSSPQEPNGSVRTPLSPVLKIVQDKLGSVDSGENKTSGDKMGQCLDNSLSIDLETERTNLLRANDEIS